MQMSRGEQEVVYLFLNCQLRAGRVFIGRDGEYSD